MQLTYQVIQSLKNGQFCSGSDLARDLNVGRTAIWNAIEQLRQLGVAIDAVTGRGYKLTKPLELLDKRQILAGLHEQVRAKLDSIAILPVVSSTNDFLLSAPFPTGQSFQVCISESQTHGKGRQGKVWDSPFGRNLYFSLRGECDCPQRVTGMSLMVAICILKALKQLGYYSADLGIKWPNDLLYHNKKLGGILIETQQNTSCSHKKLSYVIGIGLNFDLSVLSEPMAARIDLHTIFGRDISRNIFISALINQLFLDLGAFFAHGFAGFHADWSQYDLLNGKEIIINTPKSNQQGVCHGVNQRGELLVMINGERKALTCGEISIVAPNGKF